MNINSTKKRLSSKRGFTLVEMIVSIGLFAVVMVVCIGALLALTNANRKAQALQSVMNNLNITVDGMVRNLRMGTNFQCITSVGSAPVAACNGNNGDTGGVGVEFEPHGGNPLTADQWIYELYSDSTGSYIRRSEDAGTSWQQLTAPEISISYMKVYVVGTTRGDAIQPKVLIILKGTAGILSAQTVSPFHIQATAVQRLLDI